MDQEKSNMENSSGTNMVGPSGSTNYTSETLRLELIDGEKPNNVQDLPQTQANLLASQGQKKKTPSFQITSVVFNPEVPDNGEESPDETEETSDIVDSSKITSDIEQETPSFSEEYSKSEDIGAPVTATVIPTSSQYGITAVVQQNESGGLLTSRLPQGITVNVTTGGIAIAEADGGVPGNDTENLSNRFKIVKIASNKPFKKGRWVCFDFMDSPTSSAVGIRNTDLSTQGVSIPLAAHNLGGGIQAQPPPGAQMTHAGQQKTKAQLQQPIQQLTSQSQYSLASQGGNAPQATVPYGTQISAQGYHSNASGQPVNLPPPPHGGQQQVSQMSVQQHQQLQQQIHQQQQQQLQMQQQSQSSSVIPSQTIDNKQVGTIAQQAPMTSNINNSSPMTQNVPGGNVISQSIQNTPQDTRHQQTVPMHSQALPSGHIPPTQQIVQQPMQQSTQSQQFQQQPMQQSSNQQQQSQPQQPPPVSQQQQLPPQQQTNQPTQQQQKQQQSQPPQMQQQHSMQQHQIQQQIQQQQLQQTSILPTADQIAMQTDQTSAAQTAITSYPTTQQSQQSQQQIQQQQHSSPQIQHSQQQQQQQQHQSSSPIAAAAVATGVPAVTPQSVVMSSTPKPLSTYTSITPNIGNLSNINISNMISSQMSAANISQLVKGTETGMVAADKSNEAVGDQPLMASAPDDGSGQPGDEDKPSASSVSTVAIDNKIEQAMDLVKSHLMFAVREEVDVLKERIGELMERINHLEYENTILRKYATQEAIQQLQHHAPNP